MGDSRYDFASRLGTGGAEKNCGVVELGGGRFVLGVEARDGESGDGGTTTGEEGGIAVMEAKEGGPRSLRDCLGLLRSGGRQVNRMYEG